LKPLKPLLLAVEFSTRYIEVLVLSGFWTNTPHQPLRLNLSPLSVPRLKWSASPMRLLLSPLLLVTLTLELLSRKNPRVLSFDVTWSITPLVELSKSTPDSPTPPPQHVVLNCVTRFSSLPPPDP